MVNTCCICKKEAGMEEEVSFHRIPTKENIKLKWFDAIGKEVSKRANVCSKHFHEDCVYYIKRRTYIKRRLRPGAIPTLHLAKEMLRHESTIIINNNVNSENPIDQNLISEYLIAHENTVQIEQVRMDKEDHKQESFNVEYTTCETHETENIQEKVNTVIKRKNESGEVNQKRCRMIRYLGDFCRDDFTSDINWKLFRMYYVKISKNLQVYKCERIANRLGNEKGVDVHLLEPTKLKKC